MFYLVTTEYRQKGGFSDSSKELFKSYKEKKKKLQGEKKSYKESPMGRTESDMTEVTYLTLQYIRSFGVKKKIRKYQRIIAHDKNDTSH